ncbi:polysaccharide biosynthesis tyrosine autokinase [Corynebacterium sp. S7]
MELREYAGMLRKSWILVVVFTVLGIALGAAASLLATPKYQSTTQVYVSTRAGQGSTNELVQGADYSRQMINSYVTVITTGVVLDRVVEELNLDMTGEELSAQVRASSPTDSALINIEVMDPSAEQAALIADTVRQKFEEVVVTQLESAGPGIPSPVTMTTTQAPLVPDSPISPNYTLNLLLGLLGGLAAGVAVAVIRGVMDNRVHGVREVQEVTDSPVIGSIFNGLNAEENRLVVQSLPNSVQAESYRTLRTNLQFLNVDSKRRVFVVSSANENEGKSTTSLNLALSLAQAGERVAVVEGDLRKPVFADYLGIEGGAGLTDVLIGKAEINDVLQRWGSDEFYVLPAGRIPPNPSELLGSEWMAETVRALEESFDYVIIDAPPVLAVSDAAVLGKLAVGILMVVASGATTKRNLEVALETLGTSGNRVLGIVLTMLPTTGVESKYYYTASYGRGEEESNESHERHERGARGIKKRTPSHQLRKDHDGARSS